MRKSMKALSAAATSLLLLLGAPAVLAQDAPPPQTEQIEVTDSKLALYVQAATKITELRDQFQQKMAEADSPEQAQSLQEEASTEMIGAVESFGMTVEEYNQIAYALQSDPELRERLEKLQNS
ncbi:DUF4168 domain-containing protein [Kineobactrum salinum]|uniref:DUF4168 domain-containing protein n=1 Tax=Kineobactrum salinum TaxID=2708301 RepID=A0A6C0U1L7_9GAMM|nr:DUF4168 domain-containing protein [Kineobactrum salinum]QIB65683.1 DUF4168 domain-containing protein [Kineobactrum salinum]